MPQFKKNHTIPRCLIKEWAIETPSYSGTYVYEFEKDKIHFSSGKGQSAYSFAIEPDIYVAIKNEARIQTVENWLGGVENNLDIFLREIKKNHGSYLFKDKKNFDLLLLALFSLRHRSRYNLESIHEFLSKNADYKEKISSDQEEDLGILVLENFMHCTIEEAMHYGNCELIIAKNPRGHLILGDRPFLFDRKQDEYSFIPITPFHLLSIRKINEPSTYDLNDTALTDEMVHTFNKMIAENSRQWIVARSEEILKQYIPFTRAERQKETPFYEPVEYLKYGYKIS